MTAQAPAGAPAASPTDLTIHGCALVVGEAGILVRGKSGAGKSALVLALLDLSARRQIFARLVADDRVRLHVAGDRLLALPHPAIAGLIEDRGAGIVQAAHEGRARISIVVDLLAEGDEAPRLPQAEDLVAVVGGVSLRRMALAPGLPAESAARRILAVFSDA